MASTQRVIQGVVEGSLTESATPAAEIPIPPSPLEVRHPRTNFRVQTSSAELQQFETDSREELGEGVKFRMLYGDVNFLGTLNRFGPKGREMGDKLLEKIGELADKHFGAALKESHGGDEFDLTLAYTDPVECDQRIEAFFTEFNQYRLELFDQDQASREIARAADHLAQLQRGMSLKITECQGLCHEREEQFSLNAYAKFVGVDLIAGESEAELMQRLGERARQQVEQQIAMQLPQNERRNLVGNFFLAQIEIPLGILVQGHDAAKIQGDKSCAEAKRSERPHILEAEILRISSDQRHPATAPQQQQKSSPNYDDLCSRLACAEAGAAIDIKREMWRLAAKDVRLPGEVYRVEQLFDIPVSFFLGIEADQRVTAELYDQARYGATNKNLGHDVGDLLISFNVAVLEAEFDNPALFRMGGSSVLRIHCDEPVGFKRLAAIADQMEQHAASNSKYYERYERAKADAAQRETLEQYFAQNFPGYIGNELNHSADFNPRANIGTVRVEQTTVTIDAKLTFGELWKILNAGNIGRAAA